MNMNTLQSIIGVKTADVLISALRGRGFTLEQAQSFLPEAGSSVIYALSDHGGTTDPESIRGNIDLAALATKAGVDSKLVNDGMDYIIPSILSQMEDDGLLDMSGKIKRILQDFAVAGTDENDNKIANKLRGDK
jgi:hypothetical protein